uniref:Signal recognition particle 19 kDa protein n=1 Tax=Steinernema glaseri TaxID=37863 RepID=A0A1I7YMG8_9BILA
MAVNLYASKAHSDESKWVCIYPVYLNKKRTTTEGRRVKQDLAIENPTSQEIFDILSHAGLKCRVEKNKMHPLDPNRDMNLQGRVRVQLKNDDGKPVDAKFPNRLSLIKYACEMIPKLKTRQGGAAQSQPAASGGKKKKR